MVEMVMGGEKYNRYILFLLYFFLSMEQQCLMFENISYFETLLQLVLFIDTKVKEIVCWWCWRDRYAYNKRNSWVKFIKIKIKMFKYVIGKCIIRNIQYVLQYTYMLVNMYFKILFDAKEM